MLTNEDIARLRNIAPTARIVPPAEEVPPAVEARTVRRDRLMEAMSERERFEGMGVPYDEAKR